MDVLVRNMPDDLHAKVKRGAINHGLTTNAEILRVLGAAMSDDPLARAIKEIGELRMELNKYRRIYLNVKEALRDE